MIGLADCNNFFVSCERSINPDLENKAVVVLSNNDGCVVARSNEAKALGIRMGQPAFEIRELIEKQKVIALSGNHLLYRDISLRVHDIFRRYVPEAIDYSVDESFLDVSGIPVSSLEAIGKAIYSTCLQEMHIPVTIGFSHSKTLAKIATEFCKKNTIPVGILDADKDIEDIINSLPINDLWGIGGRTVKKLFLWGVRTIGDFARLDKNFVRKNLGINGERTWLEIHKTPCIELNHVNRTLQDSISETRTFPEDITDYDYIRARIVIYATDCARKLRMMRGKCKSIGVFLRTNPFHAQPKLIKPEGIIELRHPTSDTSEIVSAALIVLDEIFISCMPFKRAGVWLSEISADIPEVGSLFDNSRNLEEINRKKSLMRVLDNINSVIGNKKLGLASQIVKITRGHNDGYSSSFQAPQR
ncbi:MAG: Y-family DNA polymerase [Muribaculaceae bacterium]|nr:Y-family DNA polymerase [Muribaculaceae bacterium]